jgi:hypothetical protein
MSERFAWMFVLLVVMAGGLGWKHYDRLQGRAEQKKWSDDWYAAHPVRQVQPTDPAYYLSHPCGPDVVPAAKPLREQETKPCRQVETHWMKGGDCTSTMENQATGNFVIRGGDKLKSGVRGGDDAGQPEGISRPGTLTIRSGTDARDPDSPHVLVTCQEYDSTNATAKNCVWEKGTLDEFVSLVKQLLEAKPWQP